MAPQIIYYILRQIVLCGLSFNCRKYFCCGSATREDLSSCCFEDCGGVIFNACCCGTVGLISSPSALSAMVSCLGVRSAVILRSRAVSSDLRALRSSSLPHVRDTMASRVGTSTRFFSARFRCWRIVSGSFSNALRKFMQAAWTMLVGLGTAVPVAHERPSPAVGRASATRAGSG